MSKIGRSGMVIILLFGLNACMHRNANLNLDEILQEEVIPYAENQVKMMTKLTQDTTNHPRSLKNDGDLLLVPSKDWTSGFFPGVLWYMYDLTDDSFFSNQAQRYTSDLYPEQFNSTTHDIGFKIYCSYGNAISYVNQAAYDSVLINSARTLTKRFNPVVGCIRSWDHHKDVWQYPVIIDNMMNLELLFWAYRYTGDTLFRDIAVSHADHTMKNHFRPDNSTYHVVDYDTLTGKVIKKDTHQGYGRESTWSRGQAWALYGFTMCYRETGYPRYLEKAEAVADYILNSKQMPEDKIPYWDYNAPEIPDEPRDISAAAINASALIELYQLSGNKEVYLDAARTMISSMIQEKYLAGNNDNNPFILCQATGSKPHDSEVNTSLIYADYYFLEAIDRYLKLSK